MFDLSHVNYLAVVVASIAGMAVGYLWYSKLMFANSWSKLVNSGVDESMGRPWLYIVNYLVYLVMAIALSQLLYYFDVSGLVAGIAVGSFAFFGFAGAAAFTENLFSGRSWKLFAINYGYQLVNLVVMGVIIALWQ